MRYSSVDMFVELPEMLHQKQMHSISHTSDDVVFSGVFDILVGVIATRIAAAAPFCEISSITLEHGDRLDSSAATICQD